MTYFISLLGGRPGWDAEVRASILAVLERVPATMMLREEDGPQPFDRDAAIEEMDGPWPGLLRLEGDGFRLRLLL